MSSGNTTNKASLRRIFKKVKKWLGKNTVQKPNQACSAVCQGMAWHHNQPLAKNVSSKALTFSDGFKYLNCNLFASFVYPTTKRGLGELSRSVTRLCTRNPQIR
jgi:hypothetical protein